MKNLFTIVCAAIFVLAISQSSFAQSKKKDKKAKVSVHGEKNNDSKFNERKNKGGGQPKKKGKKSKKNVGQIESSRQSEYHVFYKREENMANSVS